MLRTLDDHVLKEIAEDSDGKAWLDMLRRFRVEQFPVRNLVMNPLRLVIA